MRIGLVLALLLIFIIYSNALAIDNSATTQHIFNEVYNEQKMALRVKVVAGDIGT